MKFNIKETTRTIWTFKDISHEWQNLDGSVSYSSVSIYKGDPICLSVENADGEAVTLRGYLGGVKNCDHSEGQYGIITICKCSVNGIPAVGTMSVYTPNVLKIWKPEKLDVTEWKEVRR